MSTGEHGTFVNFIKLSCNEFVFIYSFECPKKLSENEKMGERGFAKSDMERVALFSEPGYISLNDHYKTTPFSK